jgi:hypothetical protein
MQPNTNRIFTKNASVRFSLIADPGLPSVRFVPEADIANPLAHAKQFAVQLISVPM